MPDFEDLRANGRSAVRQWIGERSAAEKSRRAPETKAFAACLELAAFIHNEAGGDVITFALQEAEDRLAPARGKAKDQKQSARLAANLGAAYERMAGDTTAARRLYRQALAADAKDAVALEGLERLDRAEAIDTQKEIEGVRARDLDEAMAKMPRSAPPKKPASWPAKDAATDAATKP